MRHAIMIMAHANYDMIRNIISLYDHKLIDFYIHINKLSNDWNERFIEGSSTKSKVYCVPRVPITYCNYSQVEANIMLLSHAVKEQYDYYHIISGADLPLHNVDYFINFFTENKGKEFVGFQNEYNSEYAGFRFYLNNTIRTTNGIKRVIAIRLHKLLIKLQSILKINHAKGYVGQPKKGFDWWSITHEAAIEILNKEPEFRKFFKYTYCPSELLAQTILYNSNLSKNNIYNIENPVVGSLREIDWHRGQPYVWRVEDYEYLKNSRSLFARKFDSNIDSEIIKLISNHIRQQ